MAIDIKKFRNTFIAMNVDGLPVKTRRIKVLQESITERNFKVSSNIAYSGLFSFKTDFQSTLHPLRFGPRLRHGLIISGKLMISFNCYPIEQLFGRLVIMRRICDIGDQSLYLQGRGAIGVIYISETVADEYKLRYYTKMNDGVDPLHIPSFYGSSEILEHSFNGLICFIAITYRDLVHPIYVSEEKLTYENLEIENIDVVKFSQFRQDDRFFHNDYFRISPFSSNPTCSIPQHQ
jgi:hypothetical protein